MRIAVTGATGFLGRYLVAELARQGHHCRCWYRMTSDRRELKVPDGALTWVPGDLGDPESARDLVQGCDAVIHASLFHPAGRFIGGEGELLPFVEKNVVGTIRLIESARRARVARFVFISTCAVHDKILDDRPLDETHPLWPVSHYGAHKAALEAFVHSYGFGLDYPICALRPTGIYGLAHPVQASKWFDLVAAVARGEEVECRRGGKEVHAADVARAAALLLTAPGVSGEAYNCYDRYVSEFEVATIARQIAGSRSEIRGAAPSPRHQIVTAKLRALGMQFGGRPLLEETIGAMLAAARGSGKG
jgi:nucleoside-diphosphate-sugar epimerase